MATRAVETAVPVLEHRTLPHLLRTRAEAMADAPFVRFASGEFRTFADMELRANAVAHGLRGLGVERGDRVLFVLPNSMEFIEIWFATAKLGAIEVPVNPELKGRLLAHVLSNADATVVVCHADRLEALAEVLADASPECRGIVVVGGSADAARDAGLEPPAVAFTDLAVESAGTTIDVPVHYTDPAAILYTSGTTGMAKGVVTSYNQWYVFADQLVTNMGTTGDDRYYTPLPLFHTDAQVFGVFFALMYGARVTVDERFSASRYWQSVRSAEATATNMLGAMAYILWKQPPQPDDADNPLRVCNSIPMPRFKDAFEERFGLKMTTGFGQTETSFVTLDSTEESRPGSCGRPTPYFDVQVVDEHDNPVPTGQVGEIVARPLEPWIITAGYFRMPEVTVESYRNLWWHSGDAGHFDEDGWLYFDGRIKEVIRRRGENISALEVESIVDEHPAVLESAAVAVPSELSEDEILIVVSLVPGGKAEPRELLDFFVDRMPRYMVPRYIRITDQRLPRTPTEKVSKEQLGADPLENAWDREAHGYEVPRR